MDKQKQIEDMAKVICTHITSCKDCTEYDFGYCKFLGWCKKLYNAGYRKIPENAVVLTEGEYNDLKIAKDFDYGYYNGENNMTSYYENIRLPEVRKEIAEKYHAEMEKAIESVPNATKEFVVAWKSKNDEICKEITGAE